MFRLLTWKIPSGSTTKKTFQAGQIKTNISALRASCGAGMNEGDYRAGFFPRKTKKL